jgi:SAM-dependent methyltransferase
VLSHYVPVRHTVVDKYEVAPGVLNVDIRDFRPSGRFGLIVCISTIEHVGFDEEPRDPAKAGVAFADLRNLLAPGGRMLVTFPIDYNPSFDALVRDGAIRFDRLRFVKRVSASNRWREVEATEAFAASYDDPYPMANAVGVGWVFG